jgi:hypothetical protein
LFKTESQKQAAREKEEEEKENAKVCLWLPDAVISIDSHIAHAAIDRLGISPSDSPS